MGVEIKLSDNELPVSPVFVDFLAHVIDNRDFEKAKWGDQLTEELIRYHLKRSTNMGAIDSILGTMATDIDHQDIPEI